MALRFPKLACGVAAALMLVTATVPAVGQQRDAHFVVKDMRGADMDEVLTMAATGVESLPVIVLFGADREVLAKIRDIALQSEQEGYGVRAILVGPSDLEPSLAIYANTEGLGPSNSRLGVFEDAWRVSRPIDPRTIRAAVLVQLIRGVHQEYYEPR